MRLPPFRIEEYFARHEFTTPFLLSSSDSESLPLGDLLALEPEAEERLRALWLGDTESAGAPPLRFEFQISSRPRSRATSSSSPPPRRGSSSPATRCWRRATT